MNDTDGDGICAPLDNGPIDANPSQSAADSDGLGAACDLCTCDNDSGGPDADGWCDDLDICPVVADPTQADTDGDGLSDACELCIGDTRAGVNGGAGQTSPADRPLSVNADQTGRASGGGVLGDGDRASCAST